MKTVKSSSTVRPVEWDTTSSETTVYHNFDVVEKPAQGGEFPQPAMFEYMQTQYSRAEYADHRINQNTADIAYISMMADVDLGGV